MIYFPLKAGHDLFEREYLSNRLNPEFPVTAHKENRYSLAFGPKGLRPGGRKAARPAKHKRASKPVHANTFERHRGVTMHLMMRKKKNGSVVDGEKIQSSSHGLPFYLGLLRTSALCHHFKLIFNSSKNKVL
jgi:hypothetical protein